MEITDNCLIACYGQINRMRQECRQCPVRTWCKEAATVDGQRRYRERTGVEIAAAEEMLAALPQTVETPGGEVVPGWKAMIKIISFLLSLHPTTLAVIRHRVQHPEWQREEIAAALGIKPRSVKDKICVRRSVGAMFYTPKKEISRMLSGKNVYLSGPMTGLTGFNFPAFHEAEEKIAEKFRCNVVNPAFTCHLIGDNRRHEHYIEISLAMVRTSDAVVMLPGWEKSKGAASERAEAEAHEIPVFELAEVLK